jgi:hypothetical protein
MSLKTFVQELSSDPKKLAEFQKEPHEEMTKAGLSDDEKAAINSGDSAKIQQLLGPAGGKNALLIFVYIIRGQ